MKRLVERIYEEETAIFYASAVGVIGILVLGLLFLVDDTTVLGINRWIKPIKFFASAVIFIFTTGVFLIFLREKPYFKKTISYGVIVAMAVELFLIVMQAARGTTSHFNVAEPFDAAIYSVMGIMIGINTLLIVELLLLYLFEEPDLDVVVNWGVRLGIVVFVLGSLQGGYLASQTGHTVGDRDGGPGLPFLSWSTVAGDLRVAHFLGLHAYQIVPLFALLVSGFPSGKRVGLLLVFGFAFIYLGFFAYVFIQALNGNPFPQGIFS